MKIITGRLNRANKSFNFEFVGIRHNQDVVLTRLLLYTSTDISTFSLVSFELVDRVYKRTVQYFNR